MMRRTNVIWWQLSFFEISSHGIENRIGQHTSLIDQGTVNSTINHILKFTRIGFKSNLPRHRQCFLLDHLATPVYAEGLETLLLVILDSLCNSLLLFIFEISFRHWDDILQVEIASLYVDLGLESGPTGRAKRCVDAKVDLQTQRANTLFQTLRRASRFDLTIGKGDNSNTLVPTITMYSDATAKRYSHGTREYAELKSTNS